MSGVRATLPANPRMQRTPSAPLMRKPLGRGSNKLAPVAFILLAAVFSACATSSRLSRTEIDAVAGSWQFPDRWVWIKILPDGRAFQCRIDPKGEVFRSEGRLLGGGRIEWRENWGVETIARDGDAIVLTGKLSFRYPRAQSEMRSPCNAPF